MNFTPKTTVASNLPAVSNGSLIVTTDTGELYIDSNGTRLKISDVITGTESSIRALSAPLTGKIYFATDTHKLLQASYSGATITWTEVGGISASDKAKLDELDLGDVAESAEQPRILLSNGLRWKTDSFPYATDSSLGGIIASEKTSSDTVECKIDSTTHKLFCAGGGATELNDLSDVTINNPGSGNVLMYSDGLDPNCWINVHLLLSTIQDVSINTPTPGEILQYNGVTWGNVELPVASTSTLGGVKVDGTTITISDGVISANGGSGSSTLAGLSDVTIMSVSNGDVLVYSSTDSAWQNVALQTSISSSSTDMQIPTAKCVYDIVGDIESTLQAIRGV